MIDSFPEYYSINGNTATLDFVTGTIDSYTETELTMTHTHIYDYDSGSAELVPMTGQMSDTVTWSVDGTILTIAYDHGSKIELTRK